MIKVRMLVPRTGTDLGDTVDVTSGEAERMVAAGQCEIVRSKKVERAVKSRKAEKAVK